MAPAAIEVGDHTTHVLLVAYPTQGHINPLLQFGKRLAPRHTACAVNIAYGHAWSGTVKLPVREAPGELPGLPAGLEAGDLPTFMVNPADGHGYQDMLVKQQFDGIGDADDVLVNSFSDLEPPEAEHLASTWGAKTIGPTVPSASLDTRIPDDTSYGCHLHSPSPATTAWLDAHPARSVVYAAFGSVAKASPEQMAEVAEGLLATGRPFLWVAISAGVPMVAVPRWSDQTMNAKYIADIWRVGVRARRSGGGGVVDGLVERGEVERCVREVMEREEYRRNAGKWREMAKDAVSEGGSSDANIAAFVAKYGATAK
uniref:UDP-glycosyltransferases domain-containing protein n=1 Tax=Oryza brachyantha TaxID=4533 RepID=J3MUX3_ORYBR